MEYRSFGFHVYVMYLSFIRASKKSPNLQAKHQPPTSSKYLVYSQPSHLSIYPGSLRSHVAMGEFGIVLLLAGLMRAG